MYKKTNVAAIFVLGIIMAGCSAKGDDQGLEYAPNMYHSIPYEPLSQIRDKDAGSWVSSIDDGVGEYYNSNPNNPYGMTMRTPPANTVKRSEKGYLPYRIHKDSLSQAARVLKSPLVDSDEIIKDGKMLYTRFCSHCHGEKGMGDGTVAGTEDTPVFAGIANLTGAALVNVPEGHIFHVITHGKGRMGAHGSQLSPEERWKIARYVKKQLQKQ